MESLLRDLRIAVRLLRRDRAFSLAVCLTLSLCVGANVAVFTVVRGVILRPLPFEDPARLVTLYNSYPGAGFERGANGVVDFFCAGNASRASRTWRSTTRGASP